MKKNNKNSHSSNNKQFNKIRRMRWRKRKREMKTIKKIIKRFKKKPIKNPHLLGYLKKIKIKVLQLNLIVANQLAQIKTMKIMNDSNNNK